MSNLRDIVRRHVISETKQELEVQGVEAETVPNMIDYLARNGDIDRKVDSILDAFRDEIEKNSPKKKKQKINKFVFSGIGLVLTTLIAIAVNQESWLFVWSLAGLYIVINAYFSFMND